MCLSLTLGGEVLAKGAMCKDSYKQVTQKGAPLNFQASF